MRALVMGGTRFFGKGLVERLLDAGVDVTLLNRGQRPDTFGDRVERIVADRRDLTSAPFAGRKWDIVYDQVCFDAPEALQACQLLADKVEHYVFTSTKSVYTKPGCDIPESEFDPYLYTFDHVVKTADNYGEAKRQAEATFAQKAKFPVTFVRFPIVMGKGDYTERLKFHIDHIKNNKPIALPNLDARMTFISQSDAADFLFWLTKRIAVGPVNVASPEPLKVSELLGLIEEAVGRTAIVSQNGEPSPYGIPHDWYMSVARVRGLGFELRPLMQWLPELIRSYVVLN